MPLNRCPRIADKAMRVKFKVRELEKDELRVPSACTDP
jgi:hypothetical protein